MLSEEIIERVKEESDIVEIVSEKVKLKRAGRNYTGLCPFHHEKTPSFVVSPDKGIYKCFGCGEAGNIFTFVMKTANITFPEAVKLLADKVNIEIEEQDGKHGLRDNERDKLHAMNVEAARFFLNNLRMQKDARGYFLNRGMTEKTMRSFGLGYSLNSWNSLMNHLRGKGCSELDMLKAGLIIKSEKGKCYDRFRNRVMFPVFDVKGRVIGFGGRVLDDSKPKYLNSPETMIFKKGTNLYGLNFAIKNNPDKTLIIVEGYMDCISLHQYGVKNVVASLGTALTINQAKLMKRYADKIIISYDADTAGQSATLRGLEILKSVGFDIRVLTVPQGKDPDEFVRNNGKDAFLKLVDNALPLTDYRLGKAKEGFNSSSREDVIRYAENAMEIISSLDSIEKDIYIKQVSEETKIKDQALYDILNEKLKKDVKDSGIVNIRKDFGQKLYLEPAYVKAERSLIKLLITDEISRNHIIESISADDFILEAHKNIYSYVMEGLNLIEEELGKFVEARCVDIDTSKEWVIIQDTELIYEDYRPFVNDCIREMKKYRLEESKKEIMNKIKEYEVLGKIDETIELTMELQKIQKELGGIK